MRDGSDALSRIYLQSGMNTTPHGTQPRVAARGRCPLRRTPRSSPRSGARGAPIGRRAHRDAPALEQGWTISKALDRHREAQYTSAPTLRRPDPIGGPKGWRGGRVVMQRTANPSMPVRFRPVPPSFSLYPPYNSWTLTGQRSKLFESAARADACCGAFSRLRIRCRRQNDEARFLSSKGLAGDERFAITPPTPTTARLIPVSSVGRAADC